MKITKEKKAVTVVTNPELGWDCVVGVYENEDYARSLHSSECIFFSETINTEKYKKTKQIVKKNIDIRVINNESIGCIIDTCNINYKKPTKENMESVCINFQKFLYNKGIDVELVLCDEFKPEYFIGVEDEKNVDLIETFEEEFFKEYNYEYTER